MQSHAESAQHSISFNLDQNQVFSCIPFHKQGSYVLYIIFRPRGLLTFYDSFLIKVGQPENLFSLEAFFPLNSLICITLRIIKQLHFYRAKLQWVTTKKELINSRSNVANAKATTYFSYILTICTPRHTMDKGYGNLAASIGST